MKAATAGVSAHFGSGLLIWGGLATLALGAVGMLRSQQLGRVGGYSIIMSSGMVIAATGLDHPALTAGALFYLGSSTLGAAALFLLAELVERRRQAEVDPPVPDLGERLPAFVEAVRTDVVRHAAGARARAERAMNRWLPSPFLSVALWALWLLLNDSLAPAHLLLGLFVGWLAPVLIAPLKPRGPRLHKPMVLVRLVLRVGHDVVVSAVEVAAGVLRAGSKPPRGEFVSVPLDLRDPHGLAALAIITAVVPGTVWSELAADGSTLLVHVFDLEDEAAFVASYKARYELPLREIFE